MGLNSVSRAMSAGELLALSWQDWDPRERTLDLIIGLREVVAIFRARNSADDRCYMYIGSREDSFQPSSRRTGTSILRSRASTDSKRDVAQVCCFERSVLLRSLLRCYVPDAETRPKNWPTKSVRIPTKESTRRPLSRARRSKQYVTPPGTTFISRLLQTT